MNPLVSICMPNYNCEKYIKEAIDSVLAQSYKNFELIIVDDVSNDRSVEIINSYNDPRIRFYQNESNLKMTGNINKSMSYANGELLAILHSDDKYAPDFLEIIIDKYNKCPEHKVFVTGVYNLHDDTGFVVPGYPFKEEGIRLRTEVLIRLAQQNNIGNAVNLVFHKDCLEKIGNYFSKYDITPDYDFLTRLANEYDFVYIPKLLAYYRIHAFNITHKDIRKPARYMIGQEIFYKNVIGSKIIPQDLHKELVYIGTRTRIHKAFYQGFKYRSGKMMRFMLDCSKELYSDLKFEPCWYLTYLISFLISEKMPNYILSLISFLGRLILYPQKACINRNLERLIRKYTHDVKFYQQEAV